MTATISGYQAAILAELVSEVYTIEIIPSLAEQGYRAVVVCSAGFVADHLEILYDLDVLCREIAEEAGMHFARTRMPNADPAFTAMLAAVVREHLAERS